jgi:hypothetical protein
VFSPKKDPHYIRPATRIGTFFADSGNWIVDLSKVEEFGLFNGELFARFHK